MSSKRILGIAGAAMIGTLAGTGAAHATITVENGETKGAATFARETLRKDSTRLVTGIGGGGGSYHVVSGHATESGELTVVVPIGLEVPVSSTAIVRVDLENLVLTGDTGVTSIDVTTSGDVDIAGVTFPSLTGGGRGDRRAWYTLTTGATNLVPSDGKLVFTLGRVGVDADVDVDGSLTISTTRTIGGQPLTETTEVENAVKTISMFRMGVTPTDQVASIGDGFTRFKADLGSVSDTRLMASLGEIEFGTVATSTTVYNAARGGADGPRNSDGTITAANQLVGAAEFVLTAGDASFLGDDGKMFLGRDKRCTEDELAAFSPDEDDDDKMKATLSVVPAKAYLCMDVDGVTEIPASGPYTMSINFTGVNGDNTAFPPAARTGTTFGSIGRDGTSVNIGHLTTNKAYNQRLVVVNRTGAEVTYSLTFDTAGGVTDTPGSGATGTLTMGRNELSVRDLVTFDNQRMGGSGSAVMEMNAARGDIDVMTVTTSTADGSTDTVVW